MYKENISIMKKDEKINKSISLEEKKYEYYIV
jgi:hypothetical protein